MLSLWMYVTVFILFENKSTQKGHFVLIQMRKYFIKNFVQKTNFIPIQEEGVQNTEFFPYTSREIVARLHPRLFIGRKIKRKSDQFKK